MTDVVTSKEQAKRDIRNALIGLLIVIAAVTILNEINPNLNNLNPLAGIDALNVGGTNKGPGTNTSNGSYTESSSYTDAQEQAAACGGTFTKKSDGQFVVNCPETSTPTSAEASGWPQTFNSSIDAGAATCPRGTTRQVENTSSIPPQTIVHCYSNNTSDTSSQTTVDASASYVVSDPPLPEAGFPEPGPLDGQRVQLIEFAENGYVVLTADGQKSFVGCKLFETAPPGC